MILLVLFISKHFLSFVCLLVWGISFFLFYLDLDTIMACLVFVGLDGSCGVFLFTLPRFEGTETTLHFNVGNSLQVKFEV